ncbi:MAG: AarF/UbiB family protein [Actinomycetia bacterium]|nr:AarF/UbiB family protein [Actinomycetes bacterium]
MDLFVFPLVVMTTFVFSAVAGRATRRLLGVRIGTLRTLLAGALIVSLQGPMIRSVAGGRYEDENVYAGVGMMILALAGSALIAMIVLVIAEALVPSGTIGGPIGWWRGGRGWWARMRRYAQIAVIVARHGLGPYVGRRRRARRSTHDLAQSLRSALEAGGPAFVKFGQLLSTRVDLLPEAYTAELAQLRDRVPPADWQAIEPILAGEAQLANAFARIDPEPLAAASVAQVHAAQLKDGSDVVLKVQRPGALATLTADLDILKRLARCLQRRTDWANRIGLVALVDAYASALVEEFDFALEASHAVTIGASTKRRGGKPAVRVPAVHQALSSKRVLVMERFRGRTLDSELLGNSDQTKLARAVLGSVLDQILRDGTFHADPHQGNIMMLDDGDVGLLDLGSVARLDRELRAGLRQLLLAVDRDDPRAATDALLSIVDSPDRLDRSALTRDVGRCLARYLGPGTPPGAGLLIELVRVLSAYGLRVPPEVAAAFRAVATLEGVLSQVPGFDPVAEARDLAASVRMPAFGADVRHELARALPALRELPRTIERFGRAVESGQLTVRHELRLGDAERASVRATVHQVLAGTVGSAVALMALILLQMPGGAQVSSRLDLHELLGYGLLTAGAILVTRSLVPIFTAR